MDTLICPVDANHREQNADDCLACQTCQIHLKPAGEDSAVCAVSEQVKLVRDRGSSNRGEIEGILAILDFFGYF